MYKMTTISLDKLKELVELQRPGYTLDQQFYTDPDIFEIDLNTFFLNHWIFIGHISRIPNIGDYFLFETGNESVIVIRGTNNQIYAHHNVCRHRGSRICVENNGNKKVLVCPYHAWSYNIDGSIKSARLMPENFNKDEWGLHKCNLRVYEGLIFINFSDHPDDFNEFIKPTSLFIELHDLSNAKIAHREVYPTYGNWKLTLDNFHECYHCQPSHPEYCQVHDAEYILSFGGGSQSSGVESKSFNKRLEDWNNKVQSLGHLTGVYYEKEFSQYSRSAERTPLSGGRLSETKDGKPAAPLMGKFKERDGGYTSVGPSPFNSLLMCNDFATLFTFIPKGPIETDVELTWLVHKDAVEGKDYDLQNMVWMWDKTTIADKKIIEDNQKGVLSKKYKPGPLSKMEKSLDSFKTWYLRRLLLSI
ncbi:MAG: (2Fe-2S)-binding protein [Pelagibacteraceae bacterium]|nr:(2Fe-2S)-binding protein [Pelagibacteraceae bacterium]|tara:strand:+ start:9685 stop:10935 length:1251 start_codon:yes stop_codon:yes gene_type:complete